MIHLILFFIYIFCCDPTFVANDPHLWSPSVSQELSYVGVGWWWGPYLAALCCEVCQRSHHFPQNLNFCSMLHWLILISGFCPKFWLSKISLCQCLNYSWLVVVISSVLFAQRSTIWIHQITGVGLDANSCYIPELSQKIMEFGASGYICVIYELEWTDFCWHVCFPCLLVYGILPAICPCLLAWLWGSWLKFPQFWELCYSHATSSPDVWWSPSTSLMTNLW